MVDDVQSFCSAAEVLKERGAYKIYLLATHGILAPDAPRLIEDSCIDEVNLFHTFCFVNPWSWIDFSAEPKKKYFDWCKGVVRKKG